MSATVVHDARFSDVRGDTMYRWTEAGGQQVLRRPSGIANGNTYDRAGRLVTCEHQNRRVSRTLTDGRVETVVGHYEGKRLNSPNDVVGAPNGDLYFTDPPYGLRRPDGTFGPQEIPFNGVYRIAAADGRLTVPTLLRPSPTGGPRRGLRGPAGRGRPAVPRCRPRSWGTPAAASAASPPGSRSRSSRQPPSRRDG
jgi:hypothetical protein